jgi:HTH-type transcriptional regulator/antitoxin HigA
MASKTTARVIPNTYLARIRRFPLVHIRDDTHLDEAREVIERLLAEDLDDGACDYLDVLTDLVEAYEDKHVQIPDACEGDVLRELMRANGLKQTSLAKATGIPQSTISAVLTGSRILTRENVEKLAKFFGVSPAVFLKA